VSAVAPPTAPTPAAASGSDGGFGRLVGTELLKLRSVRVWWGLLLTGVLLAFVQAGLLAGTAGLSLGPGAPPSPPPTDPAMLRTIYTGGLNYGYVVTLCLGVLGMAGEYRHQTITPTLLAVPRRSRLVASKLVAYLLAGLGYGVAFVLAGAVLGAIVVAARGYPLGLDTPGVGRAIALAALACAIWTAFGLGLGTLIRNQIVALLVGIAFAVLAGPLLALALQAAKAGAVAQYLPNQASAALVQPASGGLEQTLLPWWGGALVLLAYGVAFAALGTVLTTRRDVT
jgi:ABC-2 type transport system permease protein